MSNYDENDILEAAAAAFDSDVGRRLKGRFLTAGVLHRITNNDDAMACEVPSTGVVEAAARELEELPADEAEFYGRRADEITAAYMREAAERVWRAGEHLRLERLELLPANVIATVAAVIAFGEEVEPADDDQVKAAS